MDKPHSTDSEELALWVLQIGLLPTYDIAVKASCMQNDANVLYLCLHILKEDLGIMEAFFET